MTAGGLPGLPGLITETLSETSCRRSLSEERISTDQPADSALHAQEAIRSSASHPEAAITGMPRALKSRGAASACRTRSGGVSGLPALYSG